MFSRAKPRYTYQDQVLTDGDAVISLVARAGLGLIASQERWETPRGPRHVPPVYLERGSWKPVPDGFRPVVGGSDGSVVFRSDDGEQLLHLAPDGRETRFARPPAGFPVALVRDTLVFMTDQDDGAEDGSDPELVRAGIFATNLDGQIVWRATDSDPGFANAVFSAYGATTTSVGTVLLNVYGSFPVPGGESFGLFELDPSTMSFARLPLPRNAYGSKAVLAVGDHWLCSLGGKPHKDGQHRLRAWRRDGRGRVAEVKVPALAGWISWRVTPCVDEFVTWAGGTVRRITPMLDVD